MDGYNPFLAAIERPLLKIEAKPTQRYLPQPKQLAANLSILGLNEYPHITSINDVVEYKDVPEHSVKYQTIAAMFPPSLAVLKIQQVFNPFLRMSFEMKQQFCYNNTKPLQLFHGTKLKYVHNICMYNFDWRFCGAERGHRYGQGVNFTPSPRFAMYFCEKKTEVKVVILAEVLVRHTCVGYNNLEVPPPGYDTSIRENRKTFVKFCDGEFYPSYVIFFKKC